ncbi:hypothetical protein CCR75_004350 [Bremia lactucae]|uniref:Uncharacterized protein n=1 Tax=Bremia lactucae TaxID=4779 RepID=A0A976FJK4_BRELC|nr:hypothetical protein CCR75_004350 [Bremia lactucae]
MPLTQLPSLQHSQYGKLPSLRGSHPLNQLNQHFPLRLQTQQYLHQTQQALVQQTPVPVRKEPTTVDLTLTGPLRRGKWTRAEEVYAAATISYFCDGLLAIQYGTTLRGYLAQQLHCDPMRISKKLLPGSVFAGIKINPKIGRRAYYPCAQDSPTAAHSKEAASHHLTRLRRAFIQSIEEEEHVLEATGIKNRIKTYSSPEPVAAIGRKRSFDDINSVVQPHHAAVELTEPQIFYRFPHSTPLALLSSQYAPTSTTTTLCKLPKLVVPNDLSRRASYSTQHRSVSPVTIATSTTVLPPLRVSLVRASMG